MKKKKSQKKVSNEVKQKRIQQENLRKEQKKLQQESLRKELRRKKLYHKFKKIFICLCIIGVLIAAILYSKSREINYNLGLNEDGTLSNINISTAIQSDYKALSFSKESLMPEDSIIDSAIEDQIKLHGTLNTKASKKLKEGDTINICYTAKSSGELISSASTENGGMDLTLGQNILDSSIDKRILEHNIGETFNVTVSHSPQEEEDSLAGKNIIYEITINGIYEYPEFNDEFVSMYCSDVASTADEYKNYISEEYFENNLIDAIDSSISTNCVITEYPSDYIENTIKIAKANDIKKFNDTKKMYKQLGTTPKKVYELYGLSSESEYEDKLLSDAQNMARKSLFCQNVMVQEGMTNTPEEVKAFFQSIGANEAVYEQAIDDTGYNYVANQAMIARAIYRLKDIVTITD